MKTKNEHRALKNLVHRKREGEYEAMIADPRPKSWSAGHPAYEDQRIETQKRRRWIHWTRRSSPNVRK